MTYWQYWHKKALSVVGDQAFFNSDEAAGGKEVTNWEQASKAAQDIVISAISLIPALLSSIVDLDNLYDPGNYLEVKIGNTRVFEMLAAYATSGTGMVINFSLAAAGANTFSEFGEPTPAAIFRIPGGIKVKKGEAFTVNYHLAVAPAAAITVTMVLHAERQDIAY